MDTLFTLLICAICIACYGVVFRHISSKGNFLYEYIYFLADLFADLSYGDVIIANTISEDERKEFVIEKAMDSSLFRLLGGCAYCHVAHISLAFSAFYLFRNPFEVAYIAYCIAFSCVTLTIYNLLAKWTS